MALVKSHSNYVIKKRHQTVNGGTIYERDITTIGGQDQFAPGQTPIYKSGNFIITVNNEDNSSRHILPVNWEKNENGTVWDMDTVEQYASDSSSVEDSIVIKKDYYDLRDFAYYGSCSELIRSSITDIMNRFPGELYAPFMEYNNQIYGIPVLYYNKSGFVPVPTPEGYQRQGERLGQQDGELFLLGNPFDINLHTKYVSDSEITDVLKYFTREGYLNYEVITQNEEKGEITSFNTIPSPIESIVYAPIIENDDVKGFTLTNNSEISITITYSIHGKQYREVLNGGETKNYSIVASEFDYEIYVTDASGQNIQKVTSPDDKHVTKVVINSEDPNIVNTKVVSYKSETRYFELVSAEYNVCEGDKLGEITITYNINETVKSLIIYAYIGDNKNIVYLVKQDDLGIHIRPKEKFYNDFMQSLSIFQSLLISDKTYPKNKATFEVWEETNTGYSRLLKDYIFPIGEGGYNLGANEATLNSYLSSLLDVAVKYDELFCDNLYRIMTHEAIKNLDWTFTREYGPDDPTYEIGGEKIQKVLHIYGREFDEIKAYIDNIGNVNTLTYNDQSNLPDYFLTDNLELDGWDVKLIYPFDLVEYIDISGETETISGVTEQEELENEYNGYKIHRIFNQDTTTIVGPYAVNSKCFPNGYFYQCADSGLVKTPASAQSAFYVDSTDNKKLRRRINSYYTDRLYTMSEVNNAFEKRLRLNSRNIWRHKGTIEGIEMLLAMFGMKSKRWFDSLPQYKRTKYDENCTPVIVQNDYDFEVIEYTNFTNPLLDPVRPGKGNIINWYNSTKLITYASEVANNGFYTDYQGLPVIAKENKNGLRYLYPYLDKKAEIDGNVYYQMRGGWMKEGPFKFDRDNNIISSEKQQTFLETMRNVKNVNDIQSLLNIPGQSLKNNDIFYVDDLSGTLAIVDGTVYNVSNDGDDNLFFSVFVQNHTLKIGDALFTHNVHVSAPKQEERLYSLEDKPDGFRIDVYIQFEDGIPSIKAHSLEWTIGTFVLFDKGHEATQTADTFTHYFKLNQVAYKNEISEYGWSQIKDTDDDYYHLNSITDYFKGNNPHSGRLDYDNGHEYFTYFKQLFKYAFYNELFDSRCFDGDERPSDSLQYGFEGMIDDDLCITDYDRFLIPDSKIHSFANYYDKNCLLHKYVTEYSDSKEEYGVEYSMDTNPTYSAKVATDTVIDGTTHRIMNTKRVDINFYLKDSKYSPEGLKEIKYIEEVVFPYLTQMIPSTTIININYKDNG